MLRSRDPHQSVLFSATHSMHLQMGNRNEKNQTEPLLIVGVERTPT
jgi:hypothetical protein